MMINQFGQGGQPGMGQPQPQMGGQPPQGQPMPGGPPQQGPPQMGQQQPRQAMPAQGGPAGQQSIGPGMFGINAKPDDTAIRAAEQALMQAQMSGADPMQIGQMQMNLQNLQRDYQTSMGNYGQNQQRNYLEGMQGLTQPSGAGSIGGWGQTSGGQSQAQQDPVLAQLLGNQYGQGFSSGGGGVRS
jgi:hypothetical protein